jgi:5-formaminoimidazole-4-carboxamide-1-(beta)-D-ribofuranosyl 5'-monophosphate synthetase
MLERKEIQEIAGNYPEDATIGVLGSHSAEEVGIAAKAFGFSTVVVCQKGRDALYAKHNAHLFDKIITLDKFSDIARNEIQEKLRELNTIFIPNRSFSVYVGYDAIENSFKVPIYGNRLLLRTEERKETKNQYWLLEKAGIRIPKEFNSPNDIDRLVIVKVQQKYRPNERAFFYCSSNEEFENKSKELIEKDVISEDDLRKSRIEEFILGQKFNANFHGWATKIGDFDFLGFDERKQTNLHGILFLPAKEQLTLDMPIVNEEVGHSGLTMRESQKPLVYEAAEKFRKVCDKEFPPGIFGLFSLQGALAYDGNNLQFFVFDVSPRVPGAPVVGPTSPEMRRLSLKYSKLLNHFNISRIETAMDLPMLDIRHAIENNTLGNVVT